MPLFSQFTKIIEQEEMPTLDELVWRLSRGMSVCTHLRMHLRDSALANNEPPANDQPAPRFDDRLLLLMRNVEKYLSWGNEHADKEAKESYRKAVVDYERAIKEANRIEVRLRHFNDELLRLQKALYTSEENKTMFEGFFKFAFEQLADVLGTCQWAHKAPKPELMTGAEFRKQCLQDALNDIPNAADDYRRKTKAWIDNRAFEQVWVKGMRDALAKLKANTITLTIQPPPRGVDNIKIETEYTADTKLPGGA